MTIDVRPVEPAELGAFWDTLATAFGWQDPPADMGEWLRAIASPGRLIAALDGDGMVGVGGAHAFRMTVPGGEVPAAGVSMVGVLPTHRRRGILTRLMARMFDDALAAGEPVAYLWASEDQIYQRFGYGMAAMHAGVDLPRQAAVFLDDPGPAGSVRMLGPTEALDVVPPVYERYRLGRPGAFARTTPWWERHTFWDPPEEREGASRLRIAVWEHEGEARGYALWQVKPNWAQGVADGRLDVREAVGLDPAATREVWRFLFGIDLVTRIAASQLPADHPLQHLVVEPRRLQFKLTWPLWLRVIDLPAALESRGYAEDGEIVFDVTDPNRASNTGRWLLKAAGGRALCEPTGDGPDLRLGINEVGAVYLGGTPFSGLAQAGRVEELTAGAVALGDALFHSPLAPWCPEIF